MKPETRTTVGEQLVRRELMYTRTISVGRITKVFSNGWVEVEPQIQMIARDLSGVETPTDMPVLSRIPVGYFKAGGMVVTLPVKVGDEGVILFSDRGLSLWKETGRKAPPREAEFHGLNGAMFLPMPTSTPGAVKNFDPAALYVGSEDKQAYLRVAPGGQITIRALTSLLIETPLATFSGDVAIQGNLLVELLTQLIGAVATGATITSTGIHTAADFVRT